MSEKNTKVGKATRNRKKIGGIICFSILLFFLGLISWRMFFSSYQGAVTARIYQGGTLLYTIPLDEVQEDYELVISAENGEENTVFVSYGEISVSHASCPDQVCVKRGTVSYSQVPIVCMPNQLVIEFEKKGENTEVDTEIGYAKQNIEDSVQQKEETEIEKYSDLDFVMGTTLSQTLYGNHCEHTAELVKEKLNFLETNVLSWRIEGSDIYNINQAAGDTSVMVSKETADWLWNALELSETTKGAYSIMVGALTRLWDIDGESPKVPSKKELKKAMKTIASKFLFIEELENSTQEHFAEVSLLNSKTKLDLGAIGKGIGCDEVAKILEKEEISGAVISLGASSILFYGEKPDGEDYKMGITNPRSGEGEEQGLMGTLALKGGTYVSTSGAYEKYFEENNKRYHHILSPFTGYPADSGVISATIVSHNGMLSDALSTACLILGKKKAMEVLEQFDGVEAVLIDEKKKVLITAGLKGKLEILENDFQLEE